MTAPTRGEGVLAQLSLWLAALWWGSMTTLGFWVVPLLFAHLPSPALAGNMAARLFTAQTWVALICGLLILLISGRRTSNSSVKPVPPAVIFIVSGMLLALLSEFAVAPRIVARQNLALWHSVGSLMYLAHWVCAGLVFWKLSRTTVGGAAAPGCPKQGTAPSGGQGATRSGRPWGLATAQGSPKQGTAPSGGREPHVVGDRGGYFSQS